MSDLACQAVVLPREDSLGSQPSTAMCGVPRTLCFLGNGLVKTFTTAAGFADLEVGQTVTLKATVKSHDTYQDRRETLLTRPKLVSVGS